MNSHRIFRSCFWVIAAGVSLALAACSGPGATVGAPTSDHTATTGPAQTDTAPATAATAQTPSSTPAPLGLPTIYNLTLKDNEGYSQKATLSLYRGHKGHDREALKSAWSAVGGQGADPCQDAPVVEGLMDTQVATETSFVVYGVLSIANDSNGFSAKSMIWQWVASAPYGQTAVMGVGYSNGGNCSSITSGGGYMLTPAFGTREQWGPVPIVISVGAVYTPKHPDGDTAAMGLTFRPFMNATVTDASGNPVTGISLPSPAGS